MPCGTGEVARSTTPLESDLLQELPNPVVHHDELRVDDTRPAGLIGQHADVGRPAVRRVDDRNERDPGEDRHVLEEVFGDLLVGRIAGYSDPQTAEVRSPQGER